MEEEFRAGEWDVQGSAVRGAWWWLGGIDEAAEQGAEGSGRIEVTAISQSQIVGLHPQLCEGASSGL